MEVTNLLSFSERSQLRVWLEANHQSEPCCWVACNRSKQARPDTLSYKDIVEEALCFGGKQAEEIIGYDGAQDGIAEVFESLVVQFLAFELIPLTFLAFVLL